MALRIEEVVAARFLEEAYGAPVEAHDDGSRDSMFDLKADLPSGNTLAVEVVRLVKGQWMALWNTGPANGPFEVNVKGGWQVGIEDHGRVKDVLACLPEFIKEMESNGTNSFHSRSSFMMRSLYKQSKSLGIYAVRQASWLESGLVSIQMTGKAFTFNDEGIGVADWLSKYLNSEETKDVRFKLGQSGAGQREVFVWVGFTFMEPQVEVYLRGPLSNFPEGEVQMPEEITGVWLIGHPTKGGVKFDGLWHKVEPFYDLVKGLIPD